MSRPARADTPSTPMAVRVTQAERERIEQAAKVNRQTVSQFSRDVLLDAAEECMERRDP